MGRHWKLARLETPTTSPAHSRRQLGDTASRPQRRVLGRVIWAFFWTLLGSSRWNGDRDVASIHHSGQGSRHRRGLSKATETGDPRRWMTVVGWRRRFWDWTHSGCSRSSRARRSGRHRRVDGQGGRLLARRRAGRGPGPDADRHPRSCWSGAAVTTKHRHGPGSHRARRSKIRSKGQLTGSVSATSPPVTSRDGRTVADLIRGHCCVPPLRSPASVGEVGHHVDVAPGAF